MRTVFAGLLLTLTFPCVADTYQTLYEMAGWPDQQAHFQGALLATQQRYQTSLPTVLFETLRQNSNQRFAPQAVDSRALQALRTSLSNPQPALSFYQSSLGQRIVAAEVAASTSARLSQYADGLPRLQVSSARQQLIHQLAQVLPVSALSAEVSLALTGMAADSLSQMLPGLLSGNSTQALLETQRQRMIQQIDVDNTLLHVYHPLSDSELTQYLRFAASTEGQAYYQAAIQAVRAGLAVDLQVPTDS